MPVEDNVRQRLEGLIAEGQRLRHGNQHGQVRSEEHRQMCVAWFAPVQNVIQLVCPNPDNAYRKRSEAIIESRRGLVVQTAVGELTDLLSNLMVDIQHGLLSSVANMARAEAFDNFLDHAEVYCRDGRKNESGVIAGVVFEDSVRKICDKFSVPQKGQKLDDLISVLAKSDIISQTKAKRARVAAHVRTKATHAQWDEFDLKDVSVTIEFTRELISGKLDNDPPHRPNNGRHPTANSAALMVKPGVGRFLIV